MASTFALVGFVFLGLVLGFVDQGVLPVCLFSDLSCSVPSDSETGVLPAVTILFGFALPVAMLKPSLEKKCPVCRRFGTLELLTKTQIGAYEAEVRVNDRDRKVVRHVYDHLFVCTVCDSRIHKHLDK